MEERRINIKFIFCMIVGVIIVAIFIKSSITKFVNLDYFAYALRHYPLGLKENISYYAAITIATVELLVASSFIFFSFRKSMLLSLGLYSLFFVALISLIIKNDFFDYGCGLFYKSTNPTLMLSFDLLIIIVLLFVINYLENLSNDKSLLKFTIDFFN